MRYNKVGNLFYSVALKDNGSGNLPAGSKLDFSFIEAVESISVAGAREFELPSIGSLTGGLELAFNTYTVDAGLTARNKAAEDLPYAPPAAPFAKNALKSSNYISATLGLIKEVAANQKVTFAHKISSARKDNQTVSNLKGDTEVESNFNEEVPAETALGYIFQVNEAWSVAATYKATVGTSYTREIEYDKGGSGDEEVETTTFPYTTYGFATSYRLNEAIELQGYGNYTRNYRAGWNDVNLGNQKGFDFSQYGGNVQYSPAFFNGGTILFGIFNTKVVSEEPGVNFLLDATSTLLSYSHAF
ncbi:MAG: hypothetical protein LBQ83_06190 [Candidatus Margulisbacteria bacterium]|nr:hypothetical protein [Candidatus Margulisiibacteriota bacterium]